MIVYKLIKGTCDLEHFCTFVIEDFLEEKGFFVGYVLCNWIFRIKHHFQVFSFFKYPK